MNTARHDPAAASCCPAPPRAEPLHTPLGLYGGAFDPPHRAHVALAAAAVRELRLARLYLIPTGAPWMKQRRLTAATHRLAMAQLAFASVAHAVVDDCEIRRSGTTYTIDTLRELQSRHTCDAHPHWYMLMGADLLRTLPLWQRAHELLRQVTVAVAQRPAPPGSPDGDAPLAAAPGLEALRTVAIHPPASAISSTAIRSGLLQRRTLSAAQRLQWLRPLVPPAVARYIVQNQLYLQADEH